MQAFGASQSLGSLGDLATRNWGLDDPRLHRRVFGLDFKNPVGLAAGFDKDGVYYPLMAKLGFGSVELGTVTPRPQVGNAKPRLFRLPKDEALINRMGFNNAGVDALANNIELHGRPDGLVLGGNIGKNKDTPNANGVSDYLTCLDRLHDLVDYFTINVSSPNTPGLRNLQAREPLTALLSELQARNQGYTKPRPLLLKIAPDLADEALDDIVALTQDTQLAGIVATNTTIARTNLQSSADSIAALGTGGLSGAPLRARSTEVVEFLRNALPESVDIVGVGGITNPASALEKFSAGARLVQVYSGLVYTGPTLPRAICKAVVA